jgi:hypothetical protein
MWQHQAGRIDFVGSLLRLWRRGWGFREYGPTVGARDDGHWSVVGLTAGRRSGSTAPSGGRRGPRPCGSHSWWPWSADSSWRPLCPGPWGPADIRPDPLALRPAGIGTAIDRAPRTVGARVPGTWRRAAAPGASLNTNAPAMRGSETLHSLICEIDMSIREEADAERRETRRTYEDHKNRFIASGGDVRRFDGLHLAAAAVRRVERTLDNSGRERGVVERPATEHEIRQMLGDLAHEAGVARSAGRLSEFRRGLWPYGPPKDI